MPYFASPDGVQLFYNDVGTGEAVVFCHAWALSSGAWQYQIPDLVRAGFRSVTFDRRGHGRSDRPGRGYDFDTLPDLVALLDHLNIDPAAMVRHSFGCGEIVRLASRGGADRVTRAAFVAPIMPFLPAAFTAEELAANAAALKQDVPGWCVENAAPFFGTSPVSPGLVDWVVRQIIDRAVPVELEVREPVRRLDQRWAAAMGCVRDADAVRRGAEADLLVQPGHGK